MKKMTSKIGEVAKASRTLPRIEESIKEAQVGFFRCFEKRGWKLMSVWFCRLRWMLLRSTLRLTRPNIMLLGVWTTYG